MIKIVLVLLVVCASCVPAAEVPPTEDIRNRVTPGTDTHQPLPQFASREDWEKRKARLRQQLLFAMGLYPMPDRTPLHPQVFGRIENRDCTIEKVLIETLPGYYLGGNLYRPLKSSGKHPAVLHPHGHWTYGRLENQPLDSSPAFGINLARQGYVVFAWDMVGYNDTVQTPHDFGSPLQQLWSFGSLGLQAWNALRALDFVASLEEVDTARIGMAGASGGGSQTFLLAAVDDRLQFIAPVNMVSAIMQGGGDCENAPGLRLGTSNVEIAAMFAPKPMLLVSATGDWTRNNPTEEFPAIQRVYALYGKPENVENVHLTAPHNFNQQNREAIYRFFAKHALRESDPGPVKERNAQIPMLQNMLALSNRTLPANALTFEELFQEWQERSRKQMATADTSTIREALRLALSSEWPTGVLSEKKGEGIVLGRAGAGDRVSGIWLPGKGVPALVVGPRGAAAAQRDSSVEQLRKAGRPILLIDAFQTGAAVAKRDYQVKHFETFNAPDDACRVQDILTALAFLQQQPQSGGRVELIGLGDAAIWARFAAAIAPVRTGLKADVGSFRGNDEELLARFPVPGVQRAGGWAAVSRLLREANK